MTIEVLYFDGCPNHEPAVARVREVLESLGIEATVREVRVATPEDAQRLEFPGSPTIRVNGVDIEPAARQGRDFAMGCRRYGNSGVPPRELIESAIRDALRHERA